PRPRPSPERYPHAKGIISCARSSRNRIVVRDETDGLGATAGLDGNNVRDAGGPADRYASRIGLLAAHVEAEQPELVHDVGASSGVGRRADGTAADCSSQHPDMG